MLVKGTKIYSDNEAKAYRKSLNLLSTICEDYGYDEVILPVLSNPALWTNRSGKEIENQMWIFNDKGNRPTCLLPEVTAIIQNLYNENWSKSKKKPIRLFYQSKCFRYEQPQAGRYREFTQFGLEILGPNPEEYENEAKNVLKQCLNEYFKDSTKYEFDDNAIRGLSYYTRTGFEVRCEALGAQKQIAGGGIYKEGCGWAIGIDRLLLANQ